MIDESARERLYKVGRLMSGASLLAGGVFLAQGYLHREFTLVQLGVNTGFLALFAFNSIRVDRLEQALKRVEGASASSLK